MPQENLNKASSVESDVTSSKEHKVADSNAGVPGAQSSPPEDDDDGPSEDGAAGDSSTLQVIIAEFLIQSWTSGSSAILFSIWELGCHSWIILTVVFYMDSFSCCKEEKEEKQGKVGSIIQSYH